ncbi:MAG TPA: type III-B CRISPR module RAMP protein Cmr1 [Leptospiraceae bacterium]|nr:type III-B CRISPR module RAMP protein Cmr1 [Leptospiraceae bacterium]HMX34279.1 type III-B CRISPR module RAMP protein Cmr1 [Leptospiraceae bacterium]HMY32692.1 type III-B CRISPR module RAMP protein Cmr1 [Leptospiraceae bacterium]HMZ64882.1 type III-B CRISPR module RAMP protein Cmr1 [Leptospiraceae bacterium]HNA05389.1 type III-B CRISPR module RAMP protein Cmr1 [Leptospiraceae bacterium]
MEKITFECEVITPMFLGGVDGKSAELRAPSIKGALRFWWRAMNGDLPLSELHQKEAEIFGGGGDGGRRSQVVVRVEQGNLNKVSLVYQGKIASQPSFYTRPINAPILKYLSIGTFEFPGNNPRESIKENQNFRIIIQVMKKFETEIIKSLLYLSTFGGIGSKARNGFGSFKVKSINSRPVDYIQIKKNDFKNIIPKYCSFSQNIRLFKTSQSFSKWDKALEDIGDCYRLARLESDGTKYKFSNRVLLTEPLNQANDQRIIDRRTKPFFMNVRKEQNNYTGYLLYLPSDYIEDTKMLKKQLSKEQINKQYLEACNIFLKKLKTISKITEVVI